jgi:integrase
MGTAAQNTKVKEGSLRGLRPTSEEARNLFHVEDYLRWQREVRGCSASTATTYSEMLRALLDYLNVRDVRRVDATTLEDFLLRSRRGGVVGAPSTRDREIGALHSFFSYLRSRGVIDSDPTLDVGRPKRLSSQPKAIPDLTWRSVWESSLDGEARAVLGLGYFLGLRRHEIARLSPTHVDREGRRLVGFVRKGGGDDILPYGDLVDVFDRRMPPTARWVVDALVGRSCRASPRCAVPFARQGLAEGHASSTCPLWHARRCHRLNAAQQASDSVDSRSIHSASTAA